VVFDTNILIDYLLGVPQARKLLESSQKPLISIITYMEVMIGATDEDEKPIRNFLKNFEIVEVDTAIAENAIFIRKSYKIKLPDAIIWATAKTKEVVLFTRNTKDYPTEKMEIQVPYRL